jgi:hypothetical protein
MNLISGMIGFLVALFGIFIGQRTGLLHVSIAKKALDLEVTKATPKVGTSIEIDERHDNGPHYPPFLYLTTTIYNEGKLPISQLDGNWKLAASYGVPNRTIPIQREYLGSTTPYQFQPYRITQSGTAANNQFVFDVDIEFDYIVPPENQPQHYSAKYRYDYHGKRMNRVN